MTIDAITHAASDPSAAVPICSFYILQDSIRYLSDQQKVIGDEATVSDLTMLSHADKEYRSTYVFWAPYHLSIDILMIYMILRIYNIICDL